MWPDLVKVHHSGKILEVFCYFMRILFCIWQILAPTLVFSNAIWQIGIACKWPNVESIIKSYRHTCLHHTQFIKPTKNSWTKNDESVSNEDLKKFEARYHEEQQAGKVSSSAQFEYAWCLVRSKYPADIRKGIILLEDLYQVINLWILGWLNS